MDSKIDEGKLKGNKDHYCDVIAYGDWQCMKKYMGMYPHLHDLLKIHDAPEVLLYYYLNSVECNVMFMDIDYIIILSLCRTIVISGDSGVGKTTISRALMKQLKNSFVLECDRYHKWERKNTKWQNITHLDPNANYLCKMSKDIFDLRTGKDIFQVDYDHVSGKFTSMEEIKSPENLIVCGLHSSYVNSCDIKVFVEADDKLRTQWKLSRDQKTRNKTRNDIIKEMTDRKMDYIKHILPQRAKADIIVSYYGENTHIKFKITDKQGTIDYGHHKDSLKLIIKTILNVGQFNS